MNTAVKISNPAEKSWMKSPSKYRCTYNIKTNARKPNALRVGLNEQGHGSAVTAKGSSEWVQRLYYSAARGLVWK
jgi:hypothetical protein